MLSKCFLPVFGCLFVYLTVFRRANILSFGEVQFIYPEKVMAPHSSTLAWKIPWIEEPGGLQSMGSRRAGHDWATSFTFHFHALEKEMAAHSSVLAWRIPGTGKPGGLPSGGSHSVGHDWSDLAAAAAAVYLSTCFFMVSVSGVVILPSSRQLLMPEIRPAAAAKSLQSCPTLCDPIDGSPPGSLSLGFSRQEHWSGLPFPSPEIRPNKC